MSGWVSFEPDIVDVYLDGRKLALEPGQTVVPHGIDRGLDPDELREPVALTPDLGPVPASYLGQVPITWSTVRRWIARLAGVRAARGAA